MIKHNNYFEGKVQSLGFTEDGQDKTVGVVIPGDYNFGTATRKEIMKVTSGFLTINGLTFFPDDDECIIPVGKIILISTTTISSYLCSYS